MIAESTLRYQSVREPRSELRLRIREIARVRFRYGYRKILVLLKREGWLESREKAGLSVVLRRGSDAALEAATAAMRSDESEGASEADGAE